jgi:hypothetical protein
MYKTLSYCIRIFIYLQYDPSCASLGFFVTYGWRAGGMELVSHHVDIQSSRLVVIARGSVQGRPHHQIVPVLPGPTKIFPPIKQLKHHSFRFCVTYCWRAGWTEVVPHHVDIQSSRLVVIARGRVEGRPHHQIVPVLPGPAKIFPPIKQLKHHSLTKQ